MVKFNDSQDTALIIDTDDSHLVWVTWYGNHGFNRRNMCWLRGDWQHVNKVTLYEEIDAIRRGE